MREYIYIGAFIDRDEFEAAIAHMNQIHLTNRIANPHVTFQYKPKQVNESLMGEPLRIRAVGYGNDGRNEGLRVEVLTDNEEIRTLYEKIPVPHITISIGQNAQAVHTCNLDFEPITPFEMRAQFGGYTNEKTTIVNRVK